jgi:pyruvate/2-oxoglutarate dehydrogenase complex dihydrolipoamide dehydrogenase (E3) component
VLGLEPDAVVVATGTRRWLPGVPGLAVARVWPLEEVITEEPDLGRKVVVLDDDHHVAGMATADLLASRGLEVEVVNAFHVLGAEVEINTQTVYHRKLAQRRVRAHLDSHPVRVDGRTVVIENRYSGDQSTITGVDAIVVCSPGEAEDSLAAALRGRVKELRVVGDAYAPRRLLAGVHDAYTAARAL